MLAFEVEIDGRPLARAGVDDWAVLSLIISANRSRRATDNDDFRLHLGALTSPDGEGVSHHIRWGDPETILAIGSHVTLHIVDAEEVDAPARRHRSDREVEESPFSEEEMRELRYRDYLELKREFEPAAPGNPGH